MGSICLCHHGLQIACSAATNPPLHAKAWRRDCV
ncbi:Uncharacterised protein [Vibrio cholerae]|nr:Uncharacterised protein [Vibrio cholerae]